MSAFFQDKWKYNNRLTVSLGLRYDVEAIPVPEEDNPFFTGSKDIRLTRTTCSRAWD